MHWNKVTTLKCSNLEQWLIRSRERAVYLFKNEIFRIIIRRYLTVTKLNYLFKKINSKVYKAFKNANETIIVQNEIMPVRDLK